MAFRNIVINNRCKLSYSLNYLVVRKLDDEKRVLLDEFGNGFLFSNEDNIINNKNIIFIANPLELDLNSKKNISVLYKRLETNSDPDDKYLLKEIEYKIINLVDKLTLNFDIDIDYDSKLDFSKLFSLIKIRFAEMKIVDYIEVLFNYIKIVRELTNSRILVFYGLGTQLSKEEYIKFKNEIKLLDVQLLDICNMHPKYNDIVMLIDEDFCVL